MTDKLVGVHPLLIEKVHTLFARMAFAGHPMVVVQGLRTIEDQQRLYAQGRTTPGPVVTNCDGVVKRSNHQGTPDHYDGLGRAVDCVFWVEGKVSWEGPWSLYGETAKDLGLVWGGEWKSLPDRPHIELPWPPK